MKLKKIIIFLNVIVLLFNINVFAEGHIEGLDDSVNKIFMRNYITEYQKENLKKQLSDFIDSDWNDYIEYYINKYGKTPQKYTSEFKKYVLDEYVLDYENGLLTYNFTNPAYALQYSNNDLIEYLITKDCQWSIPHVNSYVGSVSCASIDFSSSIFGLGYNSEPTAYMCNIPKETIDLMNNVDLLNEVLKKHNINLVKSIRICHFARGLGIVIFDTDIGLYAYDMTYYSRYEEPDISTLANTIANYSYKTQSQKEKPDYTTEAESLVSDGLLYGNENGLDLLKPMTRAEAATILMRALGVDENAPQVATFTDVASSFWGFKYIEEAAKLGIVQGMGDGTFSPNAQVTDNQFATMVLRAAKETDFDWETAINLFVERGYITGEQADRMDLFTRGDMAKLIYEAKQHGMISK